MAIIRTWTWEIEAREEWLTAVHLFGQQIGEFDGEDFTVLWPTTGPANIRIVSIRFNDWASVDRWNEWQETPQGMQAVKDLSLHGIVIDRQSFEVIGG